MKIGILWTNNNKKNNNNNSDNNMNEIVMYTGNHLLYSCLWLAIRAGSFVVDKTNKNMASKQKLDVTIDEIS